MYMYCFYMYTICSQIDVLLARACLNVQYMWVYMYMYVFNGVRWRCPITPRIYRFCQTVCCLKEHTWRQFAGSNCQTETQVWTTCTCSHQFPNCSVVTDAPAASFRSHIVWPHNVRVLDTMRVSVMTWRLCLMASVEYVEYVHVDNCCAQTWRRVCWRRLCEYEDPCMLQSSTTCGNGARIVLLELFHHPSPPTTSSLLLKLCQFPAPDCILKHVDVCTCRHKNSTSMWTHAKCVLSVIALVTSHYPLEIFILIVYILRVYTCTSRLRWHLTLCHGWLSIRCLRASSIV